MFRQFVKVTSLQRPWTLCLALLAGCSLPATQDAPESRVASAPKGARSGASLGATTRVPTTKERRDLDLPFDVCVQGQIVETVAAGGPAERASVRPGDALLALDRNKIFSLDDLTDFLRTSGPGREVTLSLVRADTGAREERTVTLDTETARSSDSGLRWDHAGLAQLDDALRHARRESKKLFVGLSGAET